MKQIIVLFFATVVLGLSLQAQDKKEELIDQVKESSWLYSMLVDRHCTFNLPDECWTHLLANRDSYSGKNTCWYLGNSLVAFAKYMEWGDDLSRKNSDSRVTKEEQKEMEGMADAFKTKFSFKIDATGMPCSKKNYELIIRYTGAIYEFLNNPVSRSEVDQWKPKTGEMHIALVMSNTVKDIVVKTDGKNFTITAPYINEPSAWDSKIYKGLAKGGS
jgi:hypothetical protein